MDYKRSWLQRTATLALYIYFLVSSCCSSLANSKGKQKGIAMPGKLINARSDKNVDSKKRNERAPAKRSSIVRSRGIRSKLLKPKLVPHNDDVYLLEFHTENNDHCEQMEPVVQRLEDDLKTKVKRINVFHRKEYMYLLESIGFDEGGQLPFYYNRRTGQAVCGATTYANLRKWGTGHLGAMFNDPPQTLQQTEEENSFSKRKDIGNTGGMMEKIMDFGSKGKKKAEENTKVAEKQHTSARDKAAKPNTKTSQSEQVTSKQVTGMSSAAQRTAARKASRAAKNNKKVEVKQ